MALDTALKRLSAVCVGSPWRGVLPYPDGTLAQGDRQTVAYLYSGILAQAPVAVSETPASRTVYVLSELRVAYVAAEDRVAVTADP